MYATYTYIFRGIFVTKVKKIHIQDMQPVLMIAKYPRATIRFCLMLKPLFYYFFIGIIGVFAMQLATIIGTPYPSGFTLGEIVSGALLYSVIIFTVSSVLSAGMIHVIAKAFKASAKFKFIYRAICLANIPFIWILPILLFWMQLSPQSYFVVEGSSLSMFENSLLLIGPFFILCASIWNLFLIFKSIQEVYRFSLKKSIVVMVLFIALFAMLTIAISSATGVTFI